MMSKILLLLFSCLICISFSFDEDLNCYFTLKYSNGSRSRCLDEECSINDLDIISLENNQCQTNYLSLKYSSYSKYFNFIVFQSSQKDISSFFSLALPNLERLLQIEFLSPFETNSPFQTSELRYLSNSISNIDTLEFIFQGNLAKEDLTIFLDKENFFSHQQIFIDTLRLKFNCTNSERVEWELIKSIFSSPPSPCPKQIDFLTKTLDQNRTCFHLTILIIVIIFICILIILILILFYWKYYSYSSLNEQLTFNSESELISIIQKF